MPTLSAHFQDDEAELVEKAAQVSGQKIGPYIADAVRTRMLREGQIPGTQEAEARKIFEDIMKAEGAKEMITRLTASTVHTLSE